MTTRRRCHTTAGPCLHCPLRTAWPGLRLSLRACRENSPSLRRHNKLQQFNRPTERNRGRCRLRGPCQKYGKLAAASTPQRAISATTFRSLRAVLTHTQRSELGVTRQLWRDVGLAIPHLTLHLMLYICFALRRVLGSRRSCGQSRAGDHNPDNGERGYGAPTETNTIINMQHGRNPRGDAGGCGGTPQRL